MKKSPVKFYFISLLCNLLFIYFLLLVTINIFRLDPICVLLFYVSHLVIFCTYLILRKLK
jgi:hypothetical protein